jgi:NADPH2:quinone reductase
MNAWRAHELGHYAEKLVWEECPEPRCPEDGVVIDVAAAGLNFPDLLAIAGRYQVKPELPFVPGLEAVGSVMVAGPESRFTPGQRVIANATSGAFGEKMAAPDGQVFSVPPSMSDEHAAAFLIAYQTSYFALVHRAALAAGETLLVLGGAGGVGTSAIQIGRHLGATVIATASSAPKREHCLAVGAHHVLDPGDGFAAAVKELTGGRGADVIYDPVGGEATGEASRCIAWNGRLLIIGFASGAIPQIPANRLLLKNIAAIGLHWGAYFDREPELIRQAHEKLLSWYEDGAVQPVIGAAYPLAELPVALGVLERREAIGKLVVRR